LNADIVCVYPLNADIVCVYPLNADIVWVYPLNADIVCVYITAVTLRGGQNVRVIVTEAIRPLLS